MNEPVQHGAPLDFSILRRHAEMRFEALDAFDEVYFLGDHTTIFALRAPAIAAALPNFAGVGAFSASPGKHARLAQQLPAHVAWRLVDLGELRARAASKRVLVIDFNEKLAGKAIAAGLAGPDMVVRDCLYALHQLGLGHTYQAVKEERDYMVAHLPRFIALAERFGDDCSRRTLFARLQALLTLERSPLIEVSFPLCDFINNFSNRAGLVVREDDIFIDAGAAHGDTISHFYTATCGRYRALHAFEPDSKNFCDLEMLCSYLPGAHAYFAGLGDSDSNVDFFENPDNRLGSNFSCGGQKTTMKIMTLDAAVEEATLIKIDVEGWEAQVIKGGANLIARCKPDMTISAYHYAKDIPALLAAVEEVAHYEHVALRHYSSSLYDTQLIFSDRQHFR